MVPEYPGITKVLFPYVTFPTISDVAEVLEVHVVPSGDVKIFT